jgi:hypothetical protein
VLHLTPNQPSACPESGTLGTVVRQDVRHNKRPAHTDWRNTDGWDLGGFPLGLRHMSGAEGPLGTPVQHCHSSLIESLIGQGNHMTNQEKILHSYYTTAVKIFLGFGPSSWTGWAMADAQPVKTSFLSSAPRTG